MPKILEPKITTQFDTVMHEEKVYLTFESKQHLNDWLTHIREEAVEAYKPVALEQLHKDARALFKSVFGKEL